MKNIKWLIVLALVIIFYFFTSNKIKNYSGPGTFIGNLNQNLFEGNYQKALSDIFNPDLYKSKNN